MSSGMTTPREEFSLVLIPLLAKEGWPRHQKMVPFRKGADGVVARELRFGMRFQTFACERPPRLRRFGGFATFYCCPWQGGECAQLKRVLQRELQNPWAS